MDTKKHTDDEERHLGFLVHDVARLMRLAFDRRVRDLGLTGAQWTVLCQVIRADGQRQIDLANATGMEKAPLGKLLDRLEAGGWILRRSDPDDRRVNRVYKTPKVSPLAEIVTNEAAALFEVALAGFTTPEAQDFLNDIIKVKANLKAHLRESDKE